MVKIAVFASGNGSNFEKIVLNSQNKYRVEILIVDREDAYVIERAKKIGIEYVYINPKEYISKEEYEKKIEKILQEKNIQLIVLAGYMRIVSSYLIKKFNKKIINIHPSYLPEFPGKNGIRDAYEGKVKYTGITIHYVNEKIDGGEIIFQKKIEIKSDWTLEILETHVHKFEHEYYPKIIAELSKKIME